MRMKDGKPGRSRHEKEVNEKNLKWGTEDLSASAFIVPYIRCVQKYLRHGTFRVLSFLLTFWMSDTLVTGQQFFVEGQRVNISGSVRQMVFFFFFLQLLSPAVVSWKQP